MREPSSTNILEPWVRQARSETGKVSVSLIRPSFRRWNSSSSVISLDMEAGGIATMPSFCHRIWPLSASISMACSALVSITAHAGVASSNGTNAKQRMR